MKVYEKELIHILSKFITDSCKHKFVKLMLEKDESEIEFRAFIILGDKNEN